MRRILVTGMSGTGKSSVLAALRGRGLTVLDTDEPGWSEWSDADGGYVWRETAISEWLEQHRDEGFVVSGAVSNQGRFYDRFDEVVLLSAPADVLLARITTRTTNDFGKDPKQRATILRDLAEVEPLLRRTCTVEIDATQQLDAVVDQVERLGAR